ncbi:hypothetical protein D3C85_1481490 [compost metagenome]
MSLLRQFKAKLAGFSGKETVRNLQHNAGSVTRVGFCSLASTMLHVEEHSQSVTYNIMGRLAFDMGDKPHSTGILFELGIVQALFGGQFSVSHCTQPFYYKVDGFQEKFSEGNLNKYSRQIGYIILSST